MKFDFEWTNRFRIRVRKPQIFRIMLTNKMLRNGQTNKRNNTKFERNLAMMVIYLPIKFDFDRTDSSRARIRKRQMFRTVLTNKN